ncbi:hypothetical protein BGZ60DRAFT_394090 [Tricladium varicosporioides]|nr:hypothetical protein BGZ60DRAFT_394090 [Hymenoscyphus varicosporioides]
MSRPRGIFPLFLATAFGIANGVWVFAPILKEQQEKEQGKFTKQHKEPLEGSAEKEDGNSKIIHAIEVAAGGRSTSTTESANTTPPKPWWSSMEFWSRKGPIEASKDQTPADQHPRKDRDSK